MATEFGGLTVGAKHCATKTVRSSDNPIIKPKNETVVFNPRGTLAGKYAYDHFDYSILNGNVMA